MNEEIKFSELAGFQPRQLEAARAVKKFKYLLYGGAAGGGKSYFLRWQAVNLLMYYAQKYGLKGVRIGLFCEDYPSLEDRQLSKIPYEFPQWLGTINQSRHEFRLDSEFGGGVLAFRNLDDPSKYLSVEFAAILIDELTKNKRETFDFLNMRLRWPGISDTKFIGGTNPGEIGHGWVKKLWITRDFSGERYDKKEFGFIPAYYTDNRFIDPSYEKQLDSLPTQLRRAYKEGDWDIFAGQYFTEWRKRLHACQPFEIPKEWPRFICGDYGFTKPSAVYWIAYDDAFDTYYSYREIYRTGMTYPDLAKEIVKQNAYDGDYAAQDVIFDPSIWAKKDSPRSGAMEMGEVFKNKLKLWPGDNDRLDGWNRIHEVLKCQSVLGLDKPRFQVFPCCKNLIRTLPELVHDETKVEDVDTNGEDHSGDAVRYGLLWHKKKYIQTKEESYEVGTKHLKASDVTISSDFDDEFGEPEVAPMFDFD